MTTYPTPHTVPVAARPPFALACRSNTAPWLLSAVVLALAGCGGGGGGGNSGGSGGTGQSGGTTPKSTDTPTYLVGGKVSGLSGQGLVLQNNAGDDLAVAASGAFAFKTALATDAGYNVSVKSQPSDPAQVCTVNAGSGKVANADVSNVAVTCSTSSFLVGGSVAGLQGAGLVLQNNAGDDIAVGADGKFRFATAIASGAGYAITVKTQPAGPTQVCSVSKGSGKVVNAAIDDVAVVCSTQSYSVGGSIAGLQGSGLVLANNSEDLPVASAGGFTFADKVASGSGYTVSVKTQPSSPSQTCSVSNGAGTVVDSNVGNVGVTCTTNSFSVGIDLRGLDGVGLVLQNNGTDLPMEANGTGKHFTVASGAAYSVSVKTQPTLVSQECTVGSNGSGTVGGADILVEVNCKSFLPRFAFLATQGLSSTGKILPYSIDPASGALSSLGSGFSATSDAVPTSMAVDAAGKHAYVATASGISQYDIGSDGKPAAMAVPKVAAGAIPASLTLDPKGRFAYALNVTQGSISTLPIAANGSLGAAVQSSAGTLPSGFAVESSGRFVYVINAGTRISAYKVDETSGSLTAPLTVNTKLLVVNIETDASGRFLYAVVFDLLKNKYGVNAYAIEADGSLTATGSTPISGSNAPTGLVSHPSGKFAYVTLGNGALRTFAIDSATGVLSATGNESASLGTPTLSAAPDASGRFMIVSIPTGAVSYPIDHDSGALGAPTGTTVPSTVVTSVALGL